MTIRSLPALLLLAAAPANGFCQGAKPAVPPASATAEKRRLVVQRPETKGAKYEYTGKFSQTSSSAIHDGDEVRPTGNLTLEATLRGILEVTEVSPKAGNVMGYTFTVKNMTLTAGGGGDEGLKPGTVVSAKVANFNTAFFIKGGEVKGNLAEGLRMALPFHYGVDEKVDEDSFEPKEPLAVGDKWKPDIVKVGAIMKKYSGADLDTARSTAEARYNGTATIEGMETDEIGASELYVRSSVPGLPEGTKLIKSTTSHQITFSMARDVKTSAVRERRTVSDDVMRWSVKHEGKEHEVEINVHAESHQTSKPVK